LDGAGVEPTIPGVLRSFRYVLVFVVVACGAGEVRAFEGYTGSRPLGMGGASRAFATGDAGPVLNPSGMSLVKSYTVDGGYQYAHRFSENFFHASVVDNTSAYGIAGGAYYTYQTVNLGSGATGHAHEGGLALSLPFGEVVSIGATLKYFRLAGVDQALSNRESGVTFDVGATVRPASVLSLAVVGTNLNDLHTGLAPLGVAYGAALLPMAGLMIVADGRTSFQSDLYTGRKGTSLMGGVEWTLVERLGLRAGGGYDASTGNGYMTAGISGLSEIGAIDVGFREDVTQREVAGVPTPRQTVVGVNLRLFVPASETQPSP
jgi:hypothetical protein